MVMQLGPNLIDFTPIGQIGEKFAKFFKERAAEQDAIETAELLARKAQREGALQTAPASDQPPARKLTPADYSPELSRLSADTEKRHGLPNGYLSTTAAVESRGDPNARNRSGASGLLQFMPETWKQYGQGSPFDPAASIEAGGKYTADSQRQLIIGLGRVPSPSELFLAHNQGAGGATKILKNPDASAVETVGLQAVVQNGGDPRMTNAQFSQHIQNMWQRKATPGQVVAQGQPPISENVENMPTPRAQQYTREEIKRLALAAVHGDARAKAALDELAKGKTFGPMQSGPGGRGQYNLQTGEWALKVPRSKKQFLTEPGTGDTYTGDEESGQLTLLKRGSRAGAPYVDEATGAYVQNEPDGKQKVLLTRDQIKGASPTSVQEYLFALGRGETKKTYPEWQEDDSKAKAQKTVIDMKAESEEQKALGGGRGKRGTEIEAGGSKAVSQISKIQLLRQLMEKSRTGSFGELEASVASVSQALGVDPSRLGLNPNQAITKAAADKIINESTVGMIGGGGEGQFPANNFSNVDLKFLLNIFPNLQNRPEANAIALDVMEAVARRNAEVSDKWYEFQEQKKAEGKSATVAEFEFMLRKENREAEKAGKRLFADAEAKIKALPDTGNSGVPSAGTEGSGSFGSEAKPIDLTGKNLTKEQAQKLYKGKWIVAPNGQKGLVQ
jgi:hypothetical protein